MARPTRIPVLIVGAGPAGCALGVLLTEHGVPCIVLDRAAFPRSKPCGELLNPGAVMALARLGFLDAVLAQRPAQIRRWTIRAEGARSAVGAYSPDVPWGLGLPRNVLDATLVSVARERGLRVEERTTVRSVRRVGNEWIIDTQRADGSPGRWRADILVGADGLRSVVARRLGLVGERRHANKLSLTCHVAGRGPDRESGFLVRRHGRTVGAAPIHDESSWWNVTVVVDTPAYGAAAARDRMTLFWTVLDESALGWTSRPAVIAGPWASGGFRVPVSRPVTDSALLVGDAAGYFDPFTGQGIQQALRSAELAAPVIEGAWRRRHTAGRQLREYAMTMRYEGWPRAVFQRGVEFVLSRDSLRGRVIGALSSAPRYADMLVQIAGDHRPLMALCRVDELLPSRGGRR